VKNRFVTDCSIPLFICIAQSEVTLKDSVVFILLHGITLHKAIILNPILICHYLS